MNFLHSPLRCSALPFYGVIIAESRLDTSEWRVIHMMLVAIHGSGRECIMLHKEGQVTFAVSEALGFVFGVSTAAVGLFPYRLHSCRTRE